MALFAAVSSNVAYACPEKNDGVALTTADENAPAAFVSIPSPPISRPFGIDMLFCGEVLEVEFDATMPAHQHGMNYDAEVLALGNNTYRVDNVVFHMPGLWEMRLDVRGPDGDFTYTGEIEVE